MKLELKSIKFTEWASQETNCYQGVVYVDGKPFAFVENDGHGASDNAHPDQRWSKANPDTKFWDEMKKVNEYLATTKPIERMDRPDGSVFEYKHDLEAWCGDEITKWLVTKDFKKILKKIAFIEDGDIYTIKAKPTALNLAKFARQNPKANLLNTMPFDKGLTAYAQHNGLSL